MIYKKKSFFFLRIISDLVLICIAFIFAAIIAQSWQILIQRNYMFILMMLSCIIWYYSSNSLDFYDDFGIRNIPAQLISILKTTFIIAVTSILFIFFTKENLFTRNFILLFSISVFIFIGCRAIIYIQFLPLLKKRIRSVSNLLIIGSGKIREEISSFISKEIEVGYKLVGFVEYQNYELDFITQLEKTITSERINEVIIALPESSQKQLEQIINLCNREAVRVHIIPDYYNLLSKKFRMGLLGNFPIITLRDEPLEELHWRILKRGFDLFFSGMILIFIFTWLMPILILIQKIFSPGKAFFIQDRIGKGNQIFRCYKFRTMKDAKEITNYEFLHHQERVTKFGGFLRKTNLDELPQFFNVFIGDMSIVGPRPHAIIYNEMYKEYIDYIKLRNLVKPGITGWAQIHGLRGDVEDETENKLRTKKRIEHDIWYIENWSFWLDIQIIIQTIWQTIVGINRGS